MSLKGIIEVAGVLIVLYIFLPSLRAMTPFLPIILPILIGLVPIILILWIAKKFALSIIREAKK